MIMNTTNLITNPFEHIIIFYFNKKNTSKLTITIMTGMYGGLLGLGRFRGMEREVAPVDSAEVTSEKKGEE